MKQTQEFDGRNVDDAIEHACSTLNVSKKKLVYDVISTGSSGIFGIVGVKKARIRVTLPEKNRLTSPETGSAGFMSIVDEAFAGMDNGREEPKKLAPQETDAPRASGKLSHQKGHPKKRGASKKGDTKEETVRERGDGIAAGDSNSAQAKPVGSKGQRSRAKTYHKKAQNRKREAPMRREAVDGRHENVEQPSKSTDSHGAVSLTAEDPLLPNDASNKAAVDPARGPGDTMTEAIAPHDTADSALSEAAPAVSSGKGYFPEGTDVVPKGDAVAEDAHKDEETYDDRDEGYPPKYKGEIPVDVSDEAVRVGRETLQKMVSLITEDATVVAETDEDRLLLRVEGGNSGVLIGRRGQTLEAMQFLTDKIINRCSESRVRLKVDIEGYMETRKANLQSLAFKMADKAKKTGKPATINQMTAQDRRIVHLALKDDHRVRTQSMGDGYYRRLVIFPKKGSWKRRKQYRKQANDS